MSAQPSYEDERRDFMDADPSIESAPGTRNRDNNRSDEPLLELTKYVLDRGPRPRTRGLFHQIAAFLSAISGSVLSTYAWMTLVWWQALGVTVYGICMFGLFAVSAAYHRGQWRSLGTVNYNDSTFCMCDFSNLSNRINCSKYIRNVSNSNNFCPVCNCFFNIF